MDKLIIVHSVKESPLWRQLSEDEQLILLFKLTKQQKIIIAMTTVSSIRYRMLQLVRTIEWLEDFLC
jgi:hypothetical protein